METTTQKMQKSLENLKQQFLGLRTNRANPDLITNIPIQYYGSTVPLQQLASVSAPEPKMLVINVFDHSAIKDIEKGILSSSLGLNPQVEGSLIRITLPDLTEDRRKEIVKVLHKYAEDTKVAVRNIRREQMDTIKEKEKTKEISEDESKKEQQEIQEVTDKHTQEIDTLAKNKEQEVLSI